MLHALERLGLVSLGVRERLPRGDELEALRAEAAHLPKLEVAAGAWADAYMLGAGALSPLNGFMDARDYAAVLDSGRLPGGHAFTIPVVLRVDEAEARRVRSAINGTTRIALRHQGEPVAIVDVAEFFVVRQYRRSGVGRRAAFLLWNRLSGHWIVRVPEGNRRALPFWAAIIAEYTSGALSESTRSGSPHAWRVFSFNSANRNVAV